MDTNNTTVSFQLEEDQSDVEYMDTSENIWSWFYLSECGLWHMFGIDNQFGFQIEQHYNQNPHSFMEVGELYKLDFSAMIMTNLATGKQQPIKRALHSETDFRFMCDYIALERIHTTLPYQLIELNRETHEFKEVARLYNKTMARHPIKKIQRIQNKDLWELFCVKKTQLRKVRAGYRPALTVEGDVKERMLFHGTHVKNLVGICMYNFDCRLAGTKTGCRFGRGVYFATEAELSCKYTSSRSVSRVMFLARVLVGECTVGHSSYARPPETQSHDYLRFFDSCVDNVFNPQQYVIFDSNQIYPEYVIEFSYSPIV